MSKTKLNPCKFSKNERHELARTRFIQSSTIRKVKDALLGDEELEERIRLAVVAIAECELRLSIVPKAEGEPGHE